MSINFITTATDLYNKPSLHSFVTSRLGLVPQNTVGLQRLWQHYFASCLLV